MKLGVSTQGPKYEAIGVSLSQLYKSPYANTSELKTSVARVQTVFYDKKTAIKSVIELPNLSPVVYRYNASFNGSVTCESKGNS